MVQLRNSHAAELTRRAIMAIKGSGICLRGGTCRDGFRIEGKRSGRECELYKWYF